MKFADESKSLAVSEEDDTPVLRDQGDLAGMGKEVQGTVLKVKCHLHSIQTKSTCHLNPKSLVQIQNASKYF